MIAIMSLWVAPESLRALRRWNTQLGADVIANVIQPGQFINLGNLTLRIQEKKPGGVLSGLFIDDRRDPQQRIDIIADRGTVQKNERGSFIVLEDGNLQRFEVGKHEPVLVAFKSYAFDMSQFNRGPPTDINYNVHEQLTRELLTPPPVQSGRNGAGEFRAELHDRLFAPIYPLTFALLAFGFLGLPRTTRQSRNFAVTVMVIAVLVVRISGFALSTTAVGYPVSIPIQYTLLLAISAVSLWMVVKGLIVDPPAGLLELVNRLVQRLVPARLRTWEQAD
jgi:lipopolysaccharide export system permease protein